MTGSAHLYIGLMSGTSADAIDAVLLEITADTVSVLGHLAKPIPSEVKLDIARLSYPGEDHLERYGCTDKALGLLFADTALELIAQEAITPRQIAAIGSHGQTVRHHPSSQPTQHFTLQIGDPSTIAARTGIITVADFRRKDMAMGGQGAPLVPAFHRHVFGDAQISRAIINIGGIANITWLPPANSSGRVVGFDTGPGNCLMDAWIQRHRGLAFDDSGTWASAGKVHKKLLASLNREPYLKKSPPKSTGKELFNLEWLKQHLDPLEKTIPPEDIQATLCAFTAQTIIDGFQHIEGSPEEVFLCGGGAMNRHLLTMLKDGFPLKTVASTAAMGIAPLHVEAAAFAWLAHRTLNQQPGNLPSVTGASSETVLGGIHYP